MCVCVCACVRAYVCACAYVCVCVLHESERGGEVQILEVVYASLPCREED